MPKFTWERVPGSSLETSVDNDGQPQYRAVFSYRRSKRRTATCSTPEEALLAREAKLKELDAEGGEPTHSKNESTHADAENSQSYPARGHMAHSNSVRPAPYPKIQRAMAASVVLGTNTHSSPADMPKRQPDSIKQLTSRHQQHILHKVSYMSAHPKEPAHQPPVPRQHLKSIGGHMLVPGYMSKVSYPAQVPVSATRSPKPNKAILGVASIVVAPTTACPADPLHETTAVARLQAEQHDDKPSSIQRAVFPFKDKYHTNQYTLGNVYGQYMPTCSSSQYMSRQPAGHDTPLAADSHNTSGQPAGHSTPLAAVDHNTSGQPAGTPTDPANPSTGSWLFKPLQPGVTNGNPGKPASGDMLHNAQEKSGLTPPVPSGRTGLDIIVHDDIPLPTQLGGCIVQLTEVYDHRLLAHGCTQLRILRNLAAGAYGSVHLGYTVLPDNCTPPRQPGSCSVVGNGSCCAAAHASGGKGSRAGYPEEYQQMGRAHDGVLFTAVKVYRSFSADFTREVETLKLLRGKEGFVQLLAVGSVAASGFQQQDEQQPLRKHADGFPCMVLQLAERTLDDIDQPCTEQQAQNWTRQLLKGLAILHSGQLAEGTVVVHRDVKPLNLLLDDAGDLLIADFSCSAQIRSGAFQVGGANGTCGSRMATIAGSECYMAPEVGNRSFASYDRTVDSHAVGMVALGLLLGGRKQLMQYAKQLPSGVSAQSLSVMNFVQDIILGHENPTLPLSGTFRDFLSCSCTPGCRQTPEELLHHSWLTP